MTRAQRAERDEAITKLREWIKPGDTVYTVLDSVSRSGMSRTIRVVLMKADDNGKPYMLHPNHAVATALGLRQAKRGDGLIVGGCGMDMGFHLVNNLSMVLYPEYVCLGKGKCPSCYHVNHRDHVRCDGYEGRFCWTPSRGMFGPDTPIPANWPRGADVTITIEGDNGEPISETRPGRLLACLTGSDDDGQTPEVCPTCKGAGYLPNPEGPERFDLMHRDGYALRHAWI